MQIQKMDNNTIFLVCFVEIFQSTMTRQVTNSVSAEICVTASITKSPLSRAERSGPTQSACEGSLLPLLLINAVCTTTTTPPRRNRFPEKKTGRGAGRTCGGSGGRGKKKKRKKKDANQQRRRAPSGEHHISRVRWRYQGGVSLNLTGTLFNSATKALLWDRETLEQTKTIKGIAPLVPNCSTCSLHFSSSSLTLSTPVVFLSHSLLLDLFFFIPFLVSFSFDPVHWGGHWGPACSASLHSSSTSYRSTLFTPPICPLRSSVVSLRSLLLSYNLLIERNQTTALSCSHSDWLSVRSDWEPGGGEGEWSEDREGEGRGGSTMVLLWQQLPPVFDWKTLLATKIVAQRTRALAAAIFLGKWQK